MNDAPLIDNSTAEERRAYINSRYPCIADCDMCGLCKVFHGMDPEVAFDEYIRGDSSFEDVSKKYRNQENGN